MHCVIYAQHSREAGMDAHISKPFDVKTLCISGSGRLARTSP